MFNLLDIFFVIFHTSLIVFNLFGWIWKPLRKLNLITLLLTGSSWFILGIFYGIGYCPLTAWHWEVLNNLGVYNLPNSYIQYLIERLTGIKTSPEYVDKLTVILYFVALILSFLSNFQSKILRWVRLK